MRRLAMITVALSLLAGCGRVPPRTYTLPDARRLEADLDMACNAVIHVLTERGYGIERLDRSAGIIQTGWLTTNPEYAAGVFVTQHQDRYSDCGKPGLGWAYRGKQSRVAVALTPLRGNDTSLRIEAAFRTQRYSDPLVWTAQPEGDMPCRSRGRLEEELTVQIQLRALAEHLERLRRGTP